MEIKTIDNKTIWEDFVITHSPHSYFQAWNWGEIEKQLNRKVWRFGMYNNDKLGLVSQVVKVQAKRGTFLHMRNGPILSRWKERVFTEWLAHMKKLGKQEDASFIRISPLIQKKNEKLIKNFGFRSAQIQIMDGEVVSVLDLDKSEEELLKNMRKTTRNLVRKGERINIAVKKSDDINDFFSLYKETYQRKKFVPHKDIKEEFDVFAKDKQADLYVASYEGKPLSVAMIAYYGNQAIFRHGASIKSKVPASYYLQWYCIKRAKEKNMKYYNLFGIADTEKKSHPWWGLSQFKKGFGGETVTVHPLYAL